MRVLLIPIDGKIPNLAIMKLSAWHKAQGDDVGLRMTDPEKIYVSVIFEKNLHLAQGIHKFYPGVDIEIGGPALGSLDIIKNLPDEVEHIMPDYDLYGIDYSIGFTTRGCIRKCPFCQVWRTEGALTEHAPITEFHHPSHKKIILFDNNLLASSRWRETLEYLIKKKLKVNISQGLDIRLVDEEKAELLSKVSAYTSTFKTPMYHFAWDLPEIEDDVRRGIELLKDAGIKGKKLTFYVLVGFNTSHEQDLYRVNTLLKLRVDPYVMVYNNKKDDHFIRHLARWTNRHRYKKCAFQDYRRLSRGLRQEVLDILDKKSMEAGE